MKILLLFLVVWGQQIANRNTGLASWQAQAILNEWFGYNYEYHPRLPDSAPALRTIAQDSAAIDVAENNTQNNVSAWLTVSPNPAYDWVKATYHTAATATDVQLLLTDTQGKIVRQQQLGNTEGQVVLDCQNLPSGFYFAVLKSKGQPNIVAKLTIIH